MSLFTDKGNNVDLWIIKAKELSEAAKVVWVHNVIPSPSSCDLVGPTAIHLMYRPAALLMGLALEVSLKALAIKKGKVKIVGDQIPKAIKTHNIDSLATLAKFHINNEEEMPLIRRLSSSVDWVSKYVLPTTKKGMVTSKYNDPYPLTRCDNDYHVYEVLLNRIMNEYYS